MRKPLRYRVVMWGFRLLCQALFVWFTLDPTTHRVNWLLLTTCICFFILGAWTYERMHKKGRQTND